MTSGGPPPEASDAGADGLEEALVRVPTGLDPELPGIDVWCVGLQQHQGRLERAVSLLSPGEIRSVDGMIEPHRSRRLLARASLRVLLSRYLSLPPAAVRFAYGPHGKPGLTGELSSAGLEFNLSTSGDCCLIAVTGRGPVGIDVEAVVPIPDGHQLARRFFAPDDWPALEAGDGDVRTFLRYWTAKEAVAKALGVGLSMSLAALPVPPRIRYESPVTVEDPAGGRWCLVRVDPGPDAVATLAVTAPPTVESG